ncbi:MAG: signal peptidase I [Ktedonobacterales bacterium]
MSQSSAGERRPVAKPKPKNFTREVIETIVLTLLIFFAVHFSIQPYQVDGPSMQPGLVSDCDQPHPTHCERVLVNLLAYDFATPAHADVVVFYPPTNTARDCSGSDATRECYVKRIIGVPGDTIQITPTSVLVNGVALKEPYIANAGSAAALGSQTDGYCAEATQPIKLGQNEYWMMGDNRTDSVDSRCFGPVARQSIIGKADAIVWPFDSIQWLHDYSSVFAHAEKK